MHAAFISQLEHNKINKTLTDFNCVDIMQDEINQFKMNKVWHLFYRPHHQSPVPDGFFKIN